MVDIAVCLIIVQREQSSPEELMRRQYIILRASWVRQIQQYLWNLACDVMITVLDLKLIVVRWNLQAQLSSIQMSLLLTNEDINQVFLLDLLVMWQVHVDYRVAQLECL